MTTLIIGLGNPGKEYENTRHNVGFIAIDKLADKLGLKWSSKSAAQAEVAEGNIDGEKIVLAKPQTFMNLSGVAVASLASTYKVEPKNVWVIYDEAALLPGVVRVRTEGSAGGHNGLKSMIDSLGTDKFGRVRIGIGESEHDVPLEDWVLGKISKDEKALISPAIESALTIIESALKNGLKPTTDKGEV